jgi:hypothetical protein
MKLFKNAELTEGVKSLHFGKVAAGTTQVTKFYIKNTEGAVLENIKFTLKPYVVIDGAKFYGEGSDSNLIKEAIVKLRNEIEIVSAPTVMNPFSSAVLELKWSPGVNLKRGFNADIDISADEIYEG